MDKMVGQGVESRVCMAGHSGRDEVVVAIVVAVIVVQQEGWQGVRARQHPKPPVHSRWWGAPLCCVIRGKLQASQSTTDKRYDMV